MIRAAQVAEVARETGDWCVVDLGFSRDARSCCIAVNDGEPVSLTFAEVVARVCAEVRRVEPRPLCLLLEAPLSVAFKSTGNPTARRPERRGTQTRYWYSGAGPAVLLGAAYLIRAVADAEPTRPVLLVEGLASFKHGGRPSDHKADVRGLREAAWQRTVIAPGSLAGHPTDRVFSAFAVMGLDFGVPPVVVLDG